MQHANIAKLMKRTIQPKILYIISGDIFAGKEAQLFNLISELSKLEVPTAVIIFNETLLCEKLKLTKTKLFLINEKKGLISLFFNIKKSIKEFQPDLLVAENYKEAILGFIASLRAKTKFVIHFHGAVENVKGLANIKMKLNYFLFQAFGRYFADKLIFPTKDLAQKFNLNSNKTQIIYNSFKFSGNDHKASLERPAILCIGRLAKVKRFDLALKAFILLLNTFYVEKTAKPKLYILGEGEERHFLEKLISKLNLRDQVELLGFKENALDYLRACDLLFISSAHEGIPTVLLEAINLNKPIVSTAVGGIPEVLTYFEGYNCQLVNKNNIKEMARAIHTVLNKQSTAVLSEKNLKILNKHFSAEIVAAQHLNLYRNLMGKK